METIEPRTRERNPLPWILVGAVLAPVLVLLFSFITADPQMRRLLILLLLPILGAGAGWVIFAINPLGKPRGWRKPILLFISILVYTLAVIFGFAIAQVGAIK